MTELIPIRAGPPEDTAPHPLRLSIDEFAMLDRAGVFENFSKSELIEGEVILVNAQFRPHAFLKTEFHDRLRDALRDLGSPIRSILEAAVAMPPDSFPEPDIVLTSEPNGQGHVPVASVALLVEVADTSLAQDLERKRRVYAQHAIPEYWVVDVQGRSVHQFWEPADDDYARRTHQPFGPVLKSTTIPGLEIDTDLPG